MLDVRRDVQTRVPIPGGPRTPRRSPWPGVASIALGAGLVANSLLGPLVADAIRYPWSASMRNQTIGLEAVSLLLIAPMAIASGVLWLRGRDAGPVLAFGPGAYTVYMFVQYVIGPEYTHYAGVLPLHLALFVLGLGVAVAAWNGIRRERLPAMSRRTERRYAVLLLGLAAFVVSRYLPNLFAAIAGDPIAPEYRRDVTMYWSIVLLDLGVVVPATIAVAIGVLRGAPWGTRAIYAVVGWFALVPSSVAAMAIVMLVNGDPRAAAGQAAMLSVAAIAFAGVAIHLYAPLFRRSARSTARR